MICGSSKGGGGASIAQYLKDEKKKHKKAGELVCDFRAYGMDGCRSIDDGLAEMQADYACKPHHPEDKDPFLHLYMRMDDGDKAQIEAKGGNIDSFLKKAEDDLMQDFFKGEHKSVSISHKDQNTGQAHRHMLVSRQNFVTGKMELNSKKWQKQELRPFIEKVEKKYAHLGIRMTGSNTLEGGRGYDQADSLEHHYDTQSFKSYASKALNTAFSQKIPTSWKDFHEACHQQGMVAVKRQFDSGKAGLVFIDKGATGKVVGGAKVFAFGANSKQDTCSLGQLQRRFGAFQTGKECGASYDPQQFYDKEAKSDLIFKSAKIEGAYSHKLSAIKPLSYQPISKPSHHSHFQKQQSQSYNTPILSIPQNRRVADPLQNETEEDQLMKELDQAIKEQDFELKKAEREGKRLIKQGKVRTGDQLIRQSAVEIQKSIQRDKEQSKLSR